MPSVNKVKSGLLLHEDFKQNSLIWTPSPNGYENIEYDGINGLRLTHSTNYKTITLEEPDGNYSFVCELNHIPIDANDIGGVIIVSNDTSYIECQSFVSSKPSYLVNANQTEQLIIDFVNQLLEQYVPYSVTDDVGTYPDVPEATGDPGTIPVQPFIDAMYPYIKFSKNRGLYSFWASTDNKTWIEIGNTEIRDANRIGFFLYSYDDITEDIINNTHFYVSNMTLYNNNYVIIDNITENQTVMLHDSNGDLICESTSPNAIYKSNQKQLYIDTTLMRMPYDNVTLTVTQDTNVIHTYQIPQMVGGDIYSLWHNIKLSIDQVEINQEELFNLGTFYHNEQTIRLDIYNTEQYQVQDLKINITSSSVYYGGNEVIGVSLYDEAETNYTFSDSVNIISIEPTESKSILIKLTDRMIQDFYQKAGEFRFKINIE